MVIPGTDLRLGENHQVEVQAQDIGVIDQEEESKIENAKGQNIGDRNSVLGMLEYHCKAASQLL